MENINKELISRFKAILICLFIVWAFAIAAKIATITTVEKQYWLKIAEKAIVYNKKIEPKRGDILGDNGELLVSNMLKFRLYIDFDNIKNYNLKGKKLKETVEKKDTIWKNGFDGMCDGLSKIFPQWTPEEFKRHLKAGIEQKNSGKKGRFGRRKYPLCPDHELYASYTQCKQAEALPILSSERIYSGLVVEKYMYRKKFFGSLASSTLGDYKVLGSKKDGTPIVDKHGLDETYDSILKGKAGIMHTEKQKEIIDIPVKNGLDIQTTLSVELQDICEKALRNGLTNKGSSAGWVILMEVKTGDIKAIVNLSLDKGGNYIETYAQGPNNETPNHALGDLREPGSIFKPIAMGIALEDGKVKVSDSVQTYGGSIRMHGFNIKDAVHPKRKWQTMTEIIQNSSNVGMALIIDNGYKNNPDQFTDWLVRLGMKTNYHLLECERTPTFRTRASSAWSKSDLQAMSRGYGTAQTALNMVTFYNAIANNGRRMKPRLVKAIMREGEVIEKFDPEVIDEQIFSPKTIEALKKMLTAVVNEKGATGSRAKSNKVSIAGKTGTALNSKGNMLSFCGFFPVENPEYTCIVQNINNVGGGGSTSAVIFKEIAETVMAKGERRPLEQAKDSINKHTPISKNGNITAAYYVLEEIGIDVDDNGISDELDAPDWGNVRYDDNGNITLEAVAENEGIVPNVKGMGAKDAVYLMNKAGLRPKITGYGKVTSQSCAAGQKARPGTIVTLTLNP